MRIEKSNNECNLEFINPVYRFSIEINQKCNLHCNYCWNEKWNNKEIDLNITKDFLDLLYQSYIKWNVQQKPKISFYAAEPLLSQNILLNLMLNPFSYTILTNGTLLTQELIKEFSISKPLLVFSLDGIKENHNFFRGDTFDLIIQNINKYDYKLSSVAMTVNIHSLPFLYDSLCLLFSLPVAYFECQLNLKDNWTNELFLEYLNILRQFINNYSKFSTLPGYSLFDRFSNLRNIDNINDLSTLEINHQLDINNHLMITNPQRSCLLIPEKRSYFFGKDIAIKNKFLSSKIKQDYEIFVKNGYNNYYYLTTNCKDCKYYEKCYLTHYDSKKQPIYLINKECYPILEQFYLEEWFK